MLPATANRVRSHTAPEINRRIDARIEESIRYHAANPDKIEARLRELDREWDIERALEANAASITVFSVLMGLMGRRAFFWLPGIVGGFLLQHALTGWCPPVPLMRRMGIRTSEEIHRERYALKALRGDFAGVSVVKSNGAAAAEAASTALRATRSPS